MGISIMAWLPSRDPHIDPRRSDDVFILSSICKETDLYKLASESLSYITYCIVLTCHIIE